MSKSCIEPSRVSRRHPLVLALAALCAASAAAAAPTASVSVVPATFRTTPDHVSGAASRSKGAPSGRVSQPSAPATTYIISNCNDDGAGSLRDALVNHAVDGDHIDLTHLTCSRISLTTGALVFGAADLHIGGPGMNALTIDAADNIGEAAFYDLGSGFLSIYGMTIANGAKYRSDADALGGCVHAQNNLYLTDVAIENCSTRSAGSHGALGGGVWSGGLTSLSTSRVTGNTTAALGGGYASGGGVYADYGLLTFESVVSGNAAIAVTSTPTFGGGLFSRGSAYVFGTEVSGNSAARLGGIGFADNNGLTSYLFDSTVSGNAANAVGGVYSRGPLFLWNSTVASNTATAYNINGGVIQGVGVEFHTSLNLVSSIIAFNTTTIPFDEISGDTTNFTGSNNLIASPSTSVNYPSDTIVGDPFIGPLQDNGGITRTHALQAESPAIGSGINLIGFPYDARGSGFLRDTNGLTDIGAFERDPDMIFINGFN